MLAGRDYDYAYFDRLTLRRAVSTLYTFVNANGKIVWIRAKTEMNFMDCSVDHLVHYIELHEPTIWIGEIKGRYPRVIEPLRPFEVESGNPSNIICRRNCD